MLNDMLKEYDAHEYVYVIEGCLDLYISNKPCDLDSKPCEQCGEYDWPYVEGYVSDIRKAKDLDDLDRIQKQRKLLEKFNLIINRFMSKTETEECKKEVCLQVDEKFISTDKNTQEQLDSYQRLLEFGIIDEATKEEQGAVKKLKK